ncbi:MAG: response regulator [Candidatus Melainabacteria bacterium]
MSKEVLVVDDEEMIRTMLARMLKSMGLNVTTVTNGQAALDALQSRDFAVDLIITDHTMPQMTGIELAKTVLDNHPDIPVVLATGFSQAIGDDVLAEVPLTRLLNKPVQLGELKSLISDVLRI